MFDRVFDALVQGWDRVSCAEIVHAYEGAGVLRFGRYHRTLTPGWHWKWPFVEHVVSVNTCVTTMRLPPQTLTTRDGQSVVVSAIIKYQITDVQPYITDIWDQADVLADVTMGAIRGAIVGEDWATIMAQPPEQKVRELVRKEVNRYGFKIHGVTFTDLGKVRSIRLVQEHGLNLAN